MRTAFFANLLCCSILLSHAAALKGEDFVGAFAEPADGGNIDTRYSRFERDTVTIVPRSHPSEALEGRSRWRTLYFAIRGMQGRTPRFRLPLVSPGSGARVLSIDADSFEHISLVWSYEANPARWNSFSLHQRTGSNPAAWTIEAENSAPFTHDVVYVSINERLPVAAFYEWLEASVFTHPFVTPTPSARVPGTFIIGYQSGAAASLACSRTIPDMPLYGFVIKDPVAHPSQLVVLVSGQHPYEGQNKVALEAAIDWILHSHSDEARRYRQRYVTLVYPFVNPTGELAGLWRGTAANPGKDTNRNWDTLLTNPALAPGIDTVIEHKHAMEIDIPALGLGEPFAVFDYHQNFGDRPGTPDYVLHSRTVPGAKGRCPSLSIYAHFFSHLSQEVKVADMPSDLSTKETLRGYMLARGVSLPLTFERSVYHTLASEWAFGAATVRALVDPTANPPPATLANTDPAPRPVAE